MTGLRISSVWSLLRTHPRGGGRYFQCRSMVSVLYQRAVAIPTGMGWLVGCQATFAGLTMSRTLAHFEESV